MQGLHWKIFANCHYKLCFADYLRDEKYILSNQQYKELTLMPLHFHTSVCCFYTLYATFQLFKFQKGNTGVHDGKGNSFMSNYMCNFILYNENLQFTKFLISFVRFK